MNRNELKALLRRTISIPSDDQEILARTKMLAEGIRSHHGVNRNGRARSDEQFERDCLLGVVREMAVAKIVGGKLNDQEWNVNDRSSFAWDVEVDNLKLEIKPHSGADYFNLSEGIARILYNNSSYFNYVVAVYVAERSDCFKIKPMMIISPDELTFGTNKSQFNNWQIYFDHRRYPHTQIWSDNEPNKRISESPGGVYRTSKQKISGLPEPQF